MRQPRYVHAALSRSITHEPSRTQRTNTFGRLNAPGPQQPLCPCCAHCSVPCQHRAGAPHSHCCSQRIARISSSCAADTSLQVQDLPEGLPCGAVAPKHPYPIKRCDHRLAHSTTAHLALARGHRQLHTSITPAQRRSFTASTSAATQLSSSVSILTPRAGTQHSRISVAPAAQQLQHIARRTNQVRSAAHAMRISAALQPPRRHCAHPRPRLQHARIGIRMHSTRAPASARAARTLFWH